MAIAPWKRLPGLEASPSRGRPRLEPFPRPSQSFSGELCLDHGGHVVGLILEFLEKFFVLVVARPAGENEEILGLVPPRLKPIRPRRHGTMKEPLEPVEGVGRRVHGGRV